MVKDITLTFTFKDTMGMKAAMNPSPVPAADDIQVYQDGEAAPAFISDAVLGR